MHRRRILTYILLLCAIASSMVAAPYLANGVKVGEVTPTTAILWTRLTQHSDANWEGAEFSRVPLTPQALLSGVGDAQLPEGAKLDDMRGALAGCPGEARVTYWEVERSDVSRTTDWRQADHNADFTVRFALDGLRPGTRYEYLVEGRIDAKSPSTASFAGAFATAPTEDADAMIRFVLATGFDWDARDDAADQGHLVYETMGSLEPNFFIHGGGVVNYAAPGPVARTLELARHKWNRMWVLKNARDFYSRTPCYMLYHPVIGLDGQSPLLGEDELLKLFREQLPTSERDFRTFRWGRHLQVWLVNTGGRGPWSNAQLAEAEKSFAASDATFKVVVVPRPLIAEERTRPEEAAFRAKAMELLARQSNLYVISGERGIQYQVVSAGSGLHEFGIGPGSDKSAEAAAGGGTGGDVPKALFSRAAGGFLEVVVDPRDAPLEIRFTFYDVDGNEVFTSAHPANS